jgi:hypothetical protein
MLSPESKLRLQVRLFASPTLRAETAGMAQWLQKEYGLSLSDSAIVLGSAVQYSVANLAGRSVGVAAKINKSLVPRR